MRTRRFKHCFGIILLVCLISFLHKHLQRGFTAIIGNHESAGQYPEIDEELDRLFAARESDNRQRKLNDTSRSEVVAQKNKLVPLVIHDSFFDVFDDGQKQFVDLDSSSVNQTEVQPVTANFARGRLQTNVGLMPRDDDDGSFVKMLQEKKMKESNVGGDSISHLPPLPSSVHDFVLKGEVAVKPDERPPVAGRILGASLTLQLLTSISSVSPVSVPFSSDAVVTRRKKKRRHRSTAGTTSVPYLSSKDSLEIRRDFVSKTTSADVNRLVPAANTTPVPYVPPSDVGLTSADRPAATDSTLSDRHEAVNDFRRATSAKVNRNEFQRDRFNPLEANPDYDLPLLQKKLPIKSSVDSVPENLAAESGGAVAVEETSPTANILSDIAVGSSMADIVVLGKLNVSRSYAVYSTTSDNREALDFIFLLPLTTLAWKRVGFDSIVIIVGSRDEWAHDPLFQLVLMSAQKLGAIFVFLEPQPEKSVMLSQVSRIFAANIIWSTFSNSTGIDDVYIIMSDADIWPLNADIYRPPVRADILSLNSDCCSPFTHRRRKYKMLPMANIGMRVKTWRSVTEKFGTSPSTIDEILTFMVREFGSVALRQTTKGDNVGWFLDQIAISALIANWVEADRDLRRVQYVPRTTGEDRIDRMEWSVPNSIDHRIDAHVLLQTFIPGVWVRVLPLVRLMYGYRTGLYDWCVNYFEEFQELFITKYRNGN